MAKIQILGAGGSSVETEELEIGTDDFILVVNGRRHRIQTNRDGDLQFALINGEDCKIRNCNSYPGVILTQCYTNNI